MGSLFRMENQAMPPSTTTAAITNQMALDFDLGLLG
jgi:hypothetical protein